MISVLYGFMLVVLIGSAYLVAAGVVQADNGALVAALAVVSATAFIADISSPKPEQKSASDFAAAPVKF